MADDRSDTELKGLERHDVLTTLQKQKNKLEQEIKKEKESIKQEKALEDWKKGTEALKACNETLSRYGLQKYMDLKKLAELPMYYIYQHPNNKKLKADNKDAKWVKEFISRGGTEAVLISQANSTRAAAWHKSQSRRRAKVSKKLRAGGGVSSKTVSSVSSEKFTGVS